MPKHALYRNPADFNMVQCLLDFMSAGIATISSEDDAASPINPAKGSSRPMSVKLQRHVCNAIYRIAKQEMVVEKINDAAYAVECPIQNKDDAFVIVYSTNEGLYQASVVDVIIDNLGRHLVSYRPMYTPATNTYEFNLPFEALYAPLIFEAASIVSAGTVEDVERAIAIARTYASPADLKSLQKDDINCFFRVCDAVEQAIETKLLQPSLRGGKIDMLPKATVDSGCLRGRKIYGPEPKVLYGEDAESGSTPLGTPLAEAKKEFAEWRASRKWTEEDRELIPDYPDDFMVPPEVMTFARLFVRTHDKPSPMVNFLWRGITSYGKSTGVELLAAMLDTPLLRMTCFSSMETQDFLATFVPDNHTEKAPAIPLEEFYNQVACDPDYAYYRVTGKEKENVSVVECLQAYIDAVAKSQSDSAGRFKLVESNYIKALARGYICEVQEISRIKDPGVMVGLNEYDRPNAMIPLVDGRHVRRSPDAMVVFTDNVGYVSCRPIDPSVLRRIHYVIDSNEMPKEMVIDRVKKNTGFNDPELLDKLYSAWKEVGEFCKNHDITEGSVSVKELENCCLAILADNMKNERKHFMSTIIAKATSDVDDQKEMSAIMALNCIEGWCA